MSDRRINLGYQPRDCFVPFHRRKQRWACIVAHRRCGKTVACILDLIDHALRCEKPNGQYHYIAPYYVQSKDVAWNYLKEYGLRIPGAETNEAELRLKLPTGATIRLYGADNYDRMRGIYSDGMILDEAADFDPRAWHEVLRPALADRQGWATWIGTPKGHNDFYDIWQRAQADPEWFALMLRASETQLLPDAELADLRASMTPEQYAQELECSFEAAILGAYYAKELAEIESRGHITDLPAEDVPTHTAWDLGIGDSTAIWFFQMVGGECRIVDHYENHGQPLAHYVAEIRARGYEEGTCYLPHDAKVRSLDTGRTRVETLQSLNCKVEIVPQQSLEDGINAVRVSLPDMWFDAHKCHYGLEALRQYHTEFDEKLKVFKNRPQHDWTSHTADAMRYLALVWREHRAVYTKPTKPADETALVVDDKGRLVNNINIMEWAQRRLKRKQLDL